VQQNGNAAIRQNQEAAAGRGACVAGFDNIGRKKRPMQVCSVLWRARRLGEPNHAHNAGNDQKKRDAALSGNLSMQRAHDAFQFINVERRVR